MTIADLLCAHAEQISALRWSWLGKAIHYPVCNPLWYVGPLDLDEWLDRWCHGTSVRIAFGPSRRVWIDFFGGHDWFDSDRWNFCHPLRNFSRSGGVTPASYGCVHEGRQQR